MMKAAAPITGGINCPPVEPTDSMAAARYGVKPDLTMVGMVTIPTASTLLTALPEIMPNNAEPTTAILAAPPRKRPMAAIEISAKKSAPPVRASTCPRMVNGMTTITATCRIAPMAPFTSRPR